MDKQVTVIDVWVAATHLIALCTISGICCFYVGTGIQFPREDACFVSVCTLIVILSFHLSMQEEAL